MLFMKGTVPFAIIMYPLNYGKISVVPFAILIFTLCLQNSGENTGDITHVISFTRPSTTLTKRRHGNEAKITQHLV